MAGRCRSLTILIGGARGHVAPARLEPSQGIGNGVDGTSFNGATVSGGLATKRRPTHVHRQLSQPSAQFAVELWSAQPITRSGPAGFRWPCFGPSASVPGLQVLARWRVRSMAVHRTRTGFSGVRHQKSKMR